MVCQKCYASLRPEHQNCPRCGQSAAITVTGPNPERITESKKRGTSLIGSIIIFGLSWWGYNAFINASVTSDVTKEYEIAARQGDKMQVCVQAGLVSAAYLQAHDEDKYREWKRREDSDCSRAGLPK
jgi:hypothetical protein